jgi:hypothetical protein
MKLPHDILKAAAESVLPGCFFYHGEGEQANIVLDGTKPDQRIVYLDDKMPFLFVTNKYGVLTGTTYSCLLMLLISSKLGDTSPVRQPRVAEMVDASARLLAELAKHPDVAAVKMIRPADIMFNQFDLNADGVTMYLNVTPRGGLNLCLPADQSQA